MPAGAFIPPERKSRFPRFGYPPPWRPDGFSSEGKKLYAGEGARRQLVENERRRRRP
jgi:hypothetical protein